MTTAPRTPSDHAPTGPTPALTRGTTWVAALRAGTVDPHHPVQLVAPRAFGDETLRQVLRPAGGGRAVRVLLTNEYGRVPLVVGSARLGVRGEGAAVVPGTDRSLTFDGATTVVVPPGGTVVTDTLDTPVLAGVDLALTLHLPEPTGLATYQADPREHSYVVPGDATDVADLRGHGGALPEAVETRSFVAGLDVLTAGAEPLVVMFGDSYIEGTGTTFGANQRVSDHLDARLDRGWVVNTGIAGNRLLLDGVGPRGLDRLDRDVLDVPGVTHVLVHLGLNDLGLPGTLGERRAEPGDVVAGLAEVAERLHAAGLVVVGMTLGPSEGVVYEGYGSPEVTRGRVLVDEWIRGSGAFDSVVDVTRILTGGALPDSLRPEYDSGDGLHFDDAGARAVADAVDLGVLGSARHAAA